MGFSRQEYWSVLPGPPPGDLPDPGIDPMSHTTPAWQVGSLPLVPLGKHFTASHTHSCILSHLSPLFFFLYLHHLSFQLDSESFGGKPPFLLWYTYTVEYYSAIKRMK